MRSMVIVAIMGKRAVLSSDRCGGGTGCQPSERLL